MKRISIIVFVLLFSCKPEPEALRYGHDVCHTCKMTLVDKKYGAELVTAKGKVYKFDDVNCMAGFIHSGYLNDQTISLTLITDYAQPGTLIPAEAAFYLKSDNLRSPMASGIAAFGSGEVLQKNKETLTGTELRWSEVLTQFE
ncbi:MAG TPA: nitrous oxide reductase accessory protein NosL [Cyclobacteriaceae bacterium]|nr:nitrous oxide reductase accessory protein NosL [Cyclobacteriaceae bacterium]